MVHEKGRAGFQVRERVHDRDGILGWRGIKEPTIPCPQGKLISKILQGSGEWINKIAPPPVPGDVRGSFWHLGHNAAKHISSIKPAGVQSYEHTANPKKVNDRLAIVIIYALKILKYLLLCITNLGRNHSPRPGTRYDSMNKRLSLFTSFLFILLSHHRLLIDR